MFFFLTATATSHIYTLSLHDALPISYPGREAVVSLVRRYSRHVRVPGSSGREGKERSRYSHGRHSPGFGALPAQALAALRSRWLHRLLRLAHRPHDHWGLRPEAVQDGIRRKWRLIVMVLSGYR